MIYNYTKCESVIAKVMADLNISEKNIRITDIREWIFEAVDKIGAPMQYILKESGSDGEPIIKIEDYQAPIPAGLLSLDTVAYSRSKNGKWEYVRSNTSAFRNRIKDCKCNCFPNTPEQPVVPEQSNTKSKKCQINTINNLDESLNYHSGDVTYFIKPGWIVTNRKDGYLKISYKKIATDERGYPLVPDLTSYLEAVYWYVVMKLSFPKYLSGKLGGKGVNNSLNTFFYIQQQWNFYRNQAYAECMMPNAGQIQSIKNDWNKLLPQFDSQEDFFSSQGDEQIIYNDYYYGY